MFVLNVGCWRKSGNQYTPGDETARILLTAGATTNLEASPSTQSGVNVQTEQITIAQCLLGFLETSNGPSETNERQ